MIEKFRRWPSLGVRTLVMSRWWNAFEALGYDEFRLYAVAAGALGENRKPELRAGIEGTGSMTIRELWVSGYRSIRRIRLPLGQVNVVVGPNACGKSNLYRGMVLLAAAARGELARTLVAEGGMPSILWAGARKKGSARVTLGVRVDDWSYELTLGLPKSRSSFPLDPVVKAEKVVYHDGRRKVVFLERGEAAVSLRGPDGGRALCTTPLFDSEAALAQIRDPHVYPELAVLAAVFSDWRFYHHFRPDPESPLRQPRSVVLTPTLSADGSDLAAALRTIVYQGRGPELDQAVDKAFPGSRLEFAGDGETARYAVALRMPGVKRPLAAAELSDGTLRYLCLLAALLSVRLPCLIALNEPETSIHPELLGPLAQLIVEASRKTQVWVTTHACALAEAVAAESGNLPIELDMVNGETCVVGQGLLAR